MDDDPRLKKLIKRLLGEFSDLNLIEQGTSGQGEIEQIISILLEDLDLLDPLCYTEEVTKAFKDTMLQKKITSKQLTTIAENLSAKKQESLFVKYILALAAFEEGAYSKCIEIITSRSEFTRIDDALDILKVSCFNTSNYAEACKFLSKSAVYDDVLFDGLRKERPTGDTVDTILSNVKEIESTPDVCSIMKFVSDFNRSDSVLLSLAKCFISTGKQEEGTLLLGKINYEDSTDSHFLKQYIVQCFSSHEYNYGYRAAKLASSVFPNEVDFSYYKAVGLYNIGREEESVEFLEKIVKDNKDYIDARKFLARIYYRKGNYSEFVEIVEPIKPDLETDLQWMLDYINAEVNSSDLDGAVKDIKRLEAEYPDNLDVLRTKLDIQVLINDTNGAFLTSRRIFETSREDKKGAEYFLRELFDRQEYEEFLKHLDEYGGENDFGNLKVASHLYLQEFDTVMDYLKKNPELLSNDSVLDAIFFVIRNDSTILKLVDLIDSVESPLPALVLKFIQGISIVWKEDLLTLVSRSSSVAVAWIIAKTTVNFRDRVKPEMISNLMSRPKFSTINNIIDAIFLIFSGRVTDDMKDSRRFFYPLSEALLVSGDVANAERKLLDSFDPKDPDAFYYYYLSQIELKKGDISSAEREISRALEKLTNANFLMQSMRIFIKTDESDLVFDTIDKIRDMDSLSSIRFDELYEYITNKKNSELRNVFLDKFESMGIKNIWVERLQRDRKKEERDFDGAAEISRVIVVSRSKTPADIRTHAELLKASSLDEEREEFLESVEAEGKDPLIDVWLGDTLFLRKEYDGAADYYKKAIDIGEKPDNIRNYPEALIESGKYEEAEAVISQMHNWKNLLLIKLYHRTGRINDITLLLENLPLETMEDEEVIKYISRILWINRQIRDKLIELFNVSRNLVLGNIIVDRMMESRDFIGAEKTMRTMMKDYPENIPNMRRLADLLHETNHPSEAVTILLKAFKVVDSKEEGSQILDTVMKIQYEIGNFPEIQKLYSVNTEYVNASNIQWIVRSFIETYDFDMADRIIGFYHGKIIPEDIFNELIDEMNSKKEFLRLQEYAGMVFDVEFRVGKVLRSEEIVSMVNIPLEMVEEVYQFIDSDEYYRPEDEHRYELLTRDVFKRIVRKTNIDNIVYVKINVLYHTLPKKDVILAKNLYMYIKKCLRQRRSPILNDRSTQSLLKSALKMGLHREPLDVAYNLNIGINEAMDIVTLMEYVSSLNR